MGRPSTGLRSLDDLLGGLRVGDNVVWEVEEEASVEPFVRAFVRAPRGAELVYVSFHVSPTEVLDRFADGWDPRRSLLVDCFTHGLGGGEDTFARFYRSRRARELRVELVREPGDPSAVQEALAGIERRVGRGGRYVFDGLTGMQELWGEDAALSFFLRSCPRLYDLGTIAYWLLERPAHGASFRSKIAHVTQVLLSLSASERGPTLRVARAEGRPADVLGRGVRYAFQGDRLRILREVPGTRLRIGEVLRARRVELGLSQAELARELGISASALSPAERGRAGLSGETLTRAWRALGLPSGLDAPADGAPIEVRRRGGRRAVEVAAGLRREDLVEVPPGGRVALLSFAPGAGGREPPFSTKRREVVVVLEGVLELSVRGSVTTLHAGDAAVLATEPLSGWRNPGPEEAKALWLVLP